MVQIPDLSLTSSVTRQISKSLSFYFLAVRIHTNNLTLLLKGLSKESDSLCNAQHITGTQQIEVSWQRALGPPEEALGRTTSHFN